MPQDTTQKTKKTGAMAGVLRRLLPRRRPNIFGVLIAVAAAAGALRLANIADYALGARNENMPAGLTRSATAEDEGHAAKTPAVASNEDAPPLSQGDVDRAVRATADQLGEPTDAAVDKNAAAPAATETPRDFTQSELDVLQSLSKRREELDQRERNLEESAAMLKAAEKEVDRKLAELNTLKAEIEKLVGQQEDMEDARITSLVKIYEAMKPKEAATIFNTLDMKVLLSVVGRMNERKLSPVLAAMDPDKARAITIRLAEQRQLPAAPKPQAPAPQAPAPAAPAPEMESPALNLPGTP